MICTQEKGKKRKIYKCNECLHCQRMIGPEGISYRCYGYVKPLNYELKKDICKPDESLSGISPEWCPKKEWSDYEIESSLKKEK